MRTLSYIALLSLASQFFPYVSHSQWKKIGKFNSTIESIYVFPSGDKVLVSVGKNFFDPSASVWYTTNGGLNWIKSLGAVDGAGLITDFVFVNDFIGYCAVFPKSTSPSSCLTTTDGGITWATLNIAGIAVAINYNSANNYLLLSQSGTPLQLSSDNGLSWSSTRSIQCQVGSSFFNANDGILSTCVNGMQYTSDGGITWVLSLNNIARDECYQIFAVPNSTLGFAISEQSNKFFSTTDRGLTWQLVTDFQSTYGKFTGCIRGTDEVIIIQSELAGAFYSMDSGKSWVNFCGPSNEYDTRFSFNNGLLFMGDSSGNIWLNRTGIGSNSSPQLSKSNISITSSLCATVEDTITFSLFDSCSGRNAELLEASLSGSPSFSLSGAGIRTITREDTLRVIYTPGPTTDIESAVIRMKLKLGWKVFDTVVSLTGQYTPARTELAPTISDTILIIPSNSCNPENSTFGFTISDPCFNTQGQLGTFYINGSSLFTVTLIGDSIQVTYSGLSYDTASLALKFRIYEYEYDTVITLYGVPSPSRDSLSFTPQLTKPSVTWEETTELLVSPTKRVENKNLSEIRFDVTLDADVLEPLTGYTTDIAGAAITMNGGVPVGKQTRYSVTITGANMTLDPSQNILRLKLRPYLSDTTITTIELSTINLNPQDPDYERCTLSAVGSDETFTLALMCGDSVLSRFLGGKPILTITSLRPNPTSGKITVDFDAATEGMVTVQIFDELGKVVKEAEVKSTSGMNTASFTLSDSESGTFYLRMQMGKTKVTGKFVKQ